MTRGRMTVLVWGWLKFNLAVDVMLVAKHISSMNSIWTLSISRSSYELLTTQCNLTKNRQTLLKAQLIKKSSLGTFFWLRRDKNPTLVMALGDQGTATPSILGCSLKLARLITIYLMLLPPFLSLRIKSRLNQVSLVYSLVEALIETLLLLSMKKKLLKTKQAAIVK